MTFCSKRQTTTSAVALSLIMVRETHAQAGPVGSQLPFESIFQLIFILGFMVIGFTIIAFVFGLFGSAAAWIGGKAQESIDEMARRQREKEALERARLDRLNRLFPKSKAPDVDWLEVQDEITVLQTDLAHLWQDYHDNAKGSLTQSQFQTAHAAWLQDTKAQVSALERANRDWSEHRTTKVAHAYSRVFATLRKSGAIEDWVTHLRKLATTAETGRQEPLPALAVASIEEVLPRLNFATHPDVWVEMHCLLGKHLAINARERESKYDDPALLDRAVSAYGKAYDKVTAANAPLKHDGLEIMQLRLDYAHVLLRLGESGNAAAASLAETILTETAASMPANASMRAMANVKLNLARAVETQGDCARGSTRKAHYVRAQALYQNALDFWEGNGVEKLSRAKRNLERLENKLRQI